MNGLRLARNYWPRRRGSRASATLSLPNAASFPGSKSKRTMFSIHRVARKLSPTSSTAEASSSSITSCSARSGTKAAPVAHSTWITRIVLWCIWRNATSPSQPSHEHPRPKSKRLESAWAGGLRGFSSYGTDFNYDYRASFTQDEMAKGRVEYNFDLVEFPSAEAPGISVFYKNESGNIFHTYSAYARGTENVVTPYNYLYLVP